MRRIISILILLLVIFTVSVGETTVKKNGKKATVKKTKVVSKDKAPAKIVKRKTIAKKPRQAAVVKKKSIRGKRKTIAEDIKSVKNKAASVKKIVEEKKLTDVKKDNDAENDIEINGDDSQMKNYFIPKHKKYVAEILTDGSGKFLSGENVDQIHPIASLTKMMTALLIIEKIEKNEMSLYDVVEVTKDAMRLGGSISGLRAGDKVTIEDLLKCAIIPSGNDSAYLLAKYGGGTEAKFIAMMNERARQLGMLNTKYYSSSGLPPYYYKKAGIYASERDYDVSTVEDIAKLSCEIIKHQIYLDISSQYYVKIKNGRITLRNHNALVAKYEGVDGLKTGFHNIGHYNIAVSVKKNGMRFIAVVFGAPTLTARENEVVKLLDGGYSNMGFSGLEKKNLDNTARN